MGLNVKHFEDDNIASKFICSHCHGVFVDPVFCRCGHVLCWVCFKRRKKRKLNCLVCSEELSVSSEALEEEWLKELGSLKVICPKGCKEVVSFGLLTQHFEDQCEFALTSCTSNSCTKKVRRIDLPDHLTKCDFRMVSCCCGVQIRFLDLRQHQLAQKCIVKENLQMIVRKRREMEQAIKDHRLSMQKQFFEEEYQHRRMVKSKQGSLRLTTAMSVRSEPGGLRPGPKDTSTVRSSHSAPESLQRTALSCQQCGKFFSGSNNHERACTWHFGPIADVFGGMCQACGNLTNTKGCVAGFHEPVSKTTARI